MNEITEKITVGICAMSKKVNSKPMGEILNRLHNYDHFEIEIFNEDLILNKPVSDWPKCDCLISFYSKDFPLKKVQEYKSLYNPFLINDLDKQWFELSTFPSQKWVTLYNTKKVVLYPKSLQNFFLYVFKVENFVFNVFIKNNNKLLINQFQTTL
jgi:hypothetical protein